MKLFLTSAGLTNKTLITTFEKLVGKKGKNVKIAFIPTAANLGEGIKLELIEDLPRLKNIGCDVEIVDVSIFDKSIWLPRLEESDVFFIGGGNTFHLMYWVEKSGLKDLLPELLKTRIYVGISAGSMIACPSIMLSEDDRETVKNLGEEVIETGLSYTDFLIKPHVHNKSLPGRTFESVQKEALKTRYPVYALDDNSAIVVNDDYVEIVSEGKWRRFN